MANAMASPTITRAGPLSDAAASASPARVVTTRRSSARLAFPTIKAGVAPSRPAPRKGRGHARDDVAGDAGRPAGFQLLAAAAEDERVAALQPHHLQPLAGEGHQHPVDLVLAVGMARLALGHADPPRGGRGEVQDLV